MAVTVTLSNHFKYQLAAQAIDLAAGTPDSIKVLLMASGYTFNKDTHATFADVSASELAAGFGYLQDTKLLTTLALAEDDANDRAEMTCDDVTWTAAAGSIGPTPGAILYDDTSADNTVIGYIDFGGNKTALDGYDFVIKDIAIRIS
jgi:hypothetical protein